MSGISPLSFVLLTALLVCGCDGVAVPTIPWHWFIRGNPAPTGVHKTKGAEEFTHLKWKFETEKPVASSLVVSDGVVYFGSHDTNLYAVNAKTGQEKWKFKTGRWVWSSPTVSDGVVYFGSAEYNLYAVNAKTGQEKWKFKAGYMVVSSAAVSDGVVYFASEGEDLYAVNAQTGEKKWGFKAGESAWFSGVVPDGDGTGYLFDCWPAVSDGIVYFGSNDGNLYALE